MYMENGSQYMGTKTKLLKLCKAHVRKLKEKKKVKLTPLDTLKTKTLNKYSTVCICFLFLPVLLEITGCEWCHWAERLAASTWSLSGWDSTLMGLGGAIEEDFKKKQKNKQYSADLSRMDLMFTNYQPELKAGAAWKQSAIC